MRLFFGIAFPDPIRRNLSLLGEPVESVRWIDEANLHLTLLFIGDVDHAGFDRLDLAARQVSAPSLSIHFTGVGTFPKPSRPSILWAGAHGGNALLQLQRKLHDAVSEMGFERDNRTFTPHVTLARVKRDTITNVRPWLERHRDFRSDAFIVTSYHLFSSEFGPGGVRYKKRGTYALLPEDSE